MTRTAQLSLSELDPDEVHGHDQVLAGEYGYRKRCVCGWTSGTFDTKRQAHNAVSSHLARTVPGTRLVKTLRKS